jgi:hypothetical protein
MKLLSLGCRPIIEVIDEVEGDGNEAERAWIVTYRLEGHNLVNATDGGEGGTPSEEVRKKLVDAAYRRPPPSPETRAKISAAGRGRVVSAETRARISAGMKGKTRTREHQNNLSAALRGKKRGPEARARMSAAAFRRGGRR